MKVFITGATGYIGFAVAQALRRAGDEVYGLTRKSDKISLLLQNEIRPVIGSMQHPASYAHLAAQCDILVHAAVDSQESDRAGLEQKTIETLIAAGQHEPKPKMFIYTSGVWVYGNSGRQPVDEATPLTPAKSVAWRPVMEQLVLSATTVRGLVLRPGCVYGKQGGLTGMWFSRAYSGQALQVVGDGDNYWAMVHVDDLAAAYMLAAHSRYSREIFNLTDHSRATTREMATAAARASGNKIDIEFIPVATAAKTLGDFAECLALDQHLNSNKAMQHLGWQPQHPGFVSEAETYFQAWKAAQN